jgi:aspartyl-tRNA(Asn)/glutamyl-tRNA(Gln) amidotransferase subunit C
VAEGFTRDQVAAIAALANLELDDAEMDVFARQLGVILAYAEEVRRIDTVGVPPTAGIAPRRDADRDDVTRLCLDRDVALANAPDPAAHAGLFKVPRVIGHEG